MVDSPSVEALHRKKGRSLDGENGHHHSSKSKKHAKNGSHISDLATVDSQEIDHDTSEKKKKKKKKKRKHLNEDENPTGGLSSIDSNVSKTVDMGNVDNSKKSKKKRKHNEPEITETPITNTSEKEKEKEAPEPETEPRPKKKKRKEKKVREENDVAPVQNEEEQEQEDENDAAPSSSKKKVNIQDRLDAMMASHDRVNESSSGSKQHRSKTSVSRGTAGGGNRKVDKEYFLSTLDSTLTHEDMLVRELFYYNQLRWLEEERGLKIRKGPFDHRENKIIEDALNEFKEEVGMNDDTFNSFVLGKRNSVKEADQYAKLWQTVTGRLTGRPNRSVRTHVRRHLRNYVFTTGPWTEDQQHALEKAVNEHGMNWNLISKLIDRSPEHCRLRWRDYKGDGFLERQKGKWSKEEDEKLKQSVHEMEEDPNEIEVTQDFWDTICGKMQGARSGRQCELRWKILNPKDGNAIFYSQPRDGPKLLERLSEQSEKVVNDNFHDINLTKLLEGMPNWTIKIIKRAWRSMVNRYVAEEGETITDHYSDFHSRLAKIKKAIDDEEEQRVKEKEKLEKRRKAAAKKKANLSKAEDTIDSDNEIDNLISGKQGEIQESQEIPQSSSSKPKKQKSKSKNIVESTPASKSKRSKKDKSKKKSKNSEDKNDSDDSIGGGQSDSSE